MSLDLKLILECKERDAMQKEIREVYIQKINAGLNQLEDRHRAFFHRLYPGGVDCIADRDLDRCLMQVNNTVKQVFNK